MGYLSVYDEIEDIYADGIRKMQGPRSDELEEAVGILTDALQQSHHPSDMERAIVDVYDEFYDQLFERERAFFEVNFIDPMLDAIRADRNDNGY